uniref:Zinc finger BED domain-containing protein RICESLEEPER 2-like n=1 Tax=Tanacetum cinerariifolium TaxID=118510 RepID=A0A6L2NQY2_TANCI|nr:zinc finger BED domain-containing protein RICESLEEPER 2-like [Tanacetum cinerariifolium]
MYSPEFLVSFQHTGSFQETAREDSPVEVTIPPTKSKPNRGRQKRTVQNDDAPRQIVWTNEEEIALCKGVWKAREFQFPVLSRMARDVLSVQATSIASKFAFSLSGRVLSNRRRKLTPGSLEMCMCLKDHLDATERIQHTSNLENTVDFEEVIYGEEVQAGEAISLFDKEIAQDETAIEARAVLDYEAETGVLFKLRHYWEGLKSSPKWMQSEVPNFLAKFGEGSGKRYKTTRSSSFNTESEEASINLNVDVGDDEEDEVKEIRRPTGRDKARGSMKKKGPRSSGSSSTNDEALARLMVSELAMHNERAIEMQKEEHKAFLEIKRREVKCSERELAIQEYKQRQKGTRFYMQPYDHLTGDALNHME